MDYSYTHTYPNTFTQNVQPVYYQPRPQPSILAGWVKGEEGAKNFVVPMGTAAWLLDQDDDSVFYMKFIDQTGRPVIKKGRYSFDEIEQTQNTEYATKADLDIFSKAIADLREEIDGLSIKKAKKKGEDE